jgi:hypothetical protein
MLRPTNQCIYKSQVHKNIYIVGIHLVVYFWPKMWKYQQELK